MTNARARIIWTLFAVFSIVAGTFLAIRFGKGYRLSTQGVAENGVLVVNSQPTGARVLVDGAFLSATNDTLYLKPGEYRVEIQKDGYFPWVKKIHLEKELVSQANARLFPLAPSLRPLTLSGAERAVPSPDGQRLLYATASSSAATKNGYYVLDLVDTPLALNRGARQIARQSALFPPATTSIVWSPDSSQVLFVSDSKAVLLDPSRMNDVEQLADSRAQLSSIFAQWEEEMYRRDRERLAKFPEEIQRVATESAVNAYFSPDEQRLLYTATAEFTLRPNLIPPKPGSNSQPQQRTTTPGGMYVYDREEDRQFAVGEDAETLAALTATPAPTATPRAARGKTPVPAPAANRLPIKRLLSTDVGLPAQRLEASPSAFTRLRGTTTEETIANFQIYHSPVFGHGLQWFPTSQHLFSADESGITLRDYDNTNVLRIYSGPFDPHFVYPWPNGNQLIILTNFNAGTNTPPNLYTIEL